MSVCTKRSVQIFLYKNPFNRCRQHPMSKEQAIHQFAPIFSQYGYDGATLTRLSQATGLGKASLYHHFRGGKEDMAAAVLEQFAQKLTEQVLVPLTVDLSTGGQSTRERLHAMTTNLRGVYDNGHTACLLEAISVGDANQLFRSTLHTIMAAWITSITQVLVAANLPTPIARQRSIEAAIAVEGALVVSRVMGDTAAFEDALTRLPCLLLRPVDGP
ncbi:MAG: TetR/AcrR family transcriptional regulator [Cyanobacteria bacterium P01_E01_bin.43]